MFQKLSTIAPVAMIAGLMSACSMSNGGSPGDASADRNLTAKLGEFNKCSRMVSAYQGDVIKDGLDEEVDEDGSNLKIVAVGAFRIAKAADQRLDVLLNCFIGPKPAMPNTMVNGESVLNYVAHRDVTANLSPQQSNELRLLRGHLIVTVLSRYAVLNHTGRIGGYSRIKLDQTRNADENLADVLAAIGDAEYELRRSSDLFKTTNDPNSDDLLNPYNLDTETSSAAIRFSNQSKDFRADEVNAIYAQLYRARRVSVIAELFKEAGKPTVKRGIGYAKGLLAFFRSPSVGGLRGLFGSIKAGVKKVATENRFGGAYIDMVRRFVDLTFKDMTAGSPKPIDKKHWQYWDSILTKACGWLASETDSKRDCTPGDYKP